MAEDFNNKIRGLKLENFTCFAKAEMDFSSGINVFIGENGTGKTHVLKVLYSFLIGDMIMFDDEYNSKRVLKNLSNLFRPEKNNINNLIRKNTKDLYSNLVLIDEDYSKHFVEMTQLGFHRGSNNFAYTHEPIYIPALEMLTFSKGFIAAYEKRENSFDETHYNLVKNLNARPLKSKALEEANKLLKEFAESINVEIEEKNEQFYIKTKSDNIEVEASLAAEGIKKLAQMMYLIKNGSLTKETILFWDEPEVNLNPKYIKIVAKFLQTLAKNGVQIFVATHDYLLAHLLSLDAEYSEETAAPPMKFFSFYKGEDGTEIEAADTIAGLQHNALLDEYAAYYDLEQALFRKSMQNV